MKNSKWSLSAALLCVMTAIVAFADVKSKSITLSTNVSVNGAKVKAGMYKVEFDSETNELSFFKNNKVIAKSTAHTERAARKAEGTRIETTQKGNDRVLTSITFGGKDERIVLSEAKGDAGSMQ